MQSNDTSYSRNVQTSVTNFLYWEDEYLFLHRSPTKKVDAGRLNGVGGKTEPGENYLDAAIRETKEETGYDVTSDAIQLAGVVKLEGGYTEDWVMCFFKIKVQSKIIPIGEKTDDGKLVWIHKDKVLDSHYELVDDVRYCFKDIVENTSIFFIHAQLDSKKKITQINISKLPR